MGCYCLEFAESSSVYGTYTAFNEYHIMLYYYFTVTLVSSKVFRYDIEGLSFSMLDSKTVTIQTKVTVK